MPYVPAVIRVDGRAFHTWTRGLTKPFDERLSNLMEITAKNLLKELGGMFAYTQSDEISILLNQATIDSQFFAGGKVQKLESLSAAYTTAVFNANNTFHKKIATFDSRAFSLPNTIEATNYFVWRERDAVRNSITGLAQSKFSHKQLHKKSTKDMHEMLYAEGINWNDLESRQKHGMFFSKTGEVFPGYSHEELMELIFS